MRAFSSRLLCCRGTSTKLASIIGPTWNVEPGNNYAAQTGSVSFAAAWGSAHTLPTNSPVANIVFEVQTADDGQVRFLVSQAAVEAAPYNADGPAAPSTNSGEAVPFTRTYADWALSTLGNAFADANADDDGDGQSNHAEFLASTNPGDARSRFETKAAEIKTEGFSLQWKAAYGVTYRVMVSNDLATWEPLPGATVVGSGQDIEIIDPTPINGRRFFRVEVQP